MVRFLRQKLCPIPQRCGETHVDGSLREPEAAHEEEKQLTRERMRKVRVAAHVRGKESARGPELVPEPDEPEADNEQTFWRREIMNRAAIAIGDAMFEDWSEFEPDPEMEAGLAWLNLADHLDELLLRRAGKLTERRPRE